MENKKEQERILAIYISKFYQKRDSKIFCIKALIISILAGALLLYLHKTGQQYNLFLVYIGAWILFFFIVSVIYYVLPNKEKWLVKSKKKLEVAEGVLTFMQKDYAFLKDELAEKKTEVVLLEKEIQNNSTSDMERLLDSKRGEVVSLQKIAGERKQLIKKVKDLRF